MLDVRDMTKIETKKVRDIDFKSVPKMEYNGRDLENPRMYSLFIKSIKKLVRNSIEYRTLAKMIKEDFFNNSSGISYCEDDGVSTELHHCPIPLEDIVELVYIKRLSNNETIDELVIAEEVIALHYHGLVGLYNLNTTEHELIHNNLFFIPIGKLWGDVKAFFNIYDNYISDYQRELFEEYLKLSEEFPDSIKNTELFDINYSKIKNNLDFSDISNIKEKLAKIVERKYSLDKNNNVNLLK